MKTLIVYASKTGTAQKCAEALVSRLPDATLCDVTKEKLDPTPYDIVVLGGSVRMGMIHTNLRQYAEGCKDLLLNKRLGIFITCGYDDLAETIIKNNLPEELVAAAKVRMSFGGEMDLEKQRGFDRIVCKMSLKELKKNGMEMPRLYPKRYSKFATELLAE